MADQPENPIRRITHAAALAAGGNFTAAIEQAERALSATGAEKKTGVRRQIERQLAEYRRGKLWLQPGVQ
jgi:hypothetical protein